MAQVTNKPGEIRKLRCSSFDYLCTCPASVLNLNLLRVNQHNSLANIGNAVHQVATQVVADSKSVIDYDSICHSQGILEETDKRIVIALTHYMKEAWERLAQYFVSPITEKPCGISLDINEDTFLITGQIDVYSQTDASKHIIIDWKSGFVQRGYEHQMNAYAYCVWASEGKPKDFVLTSVVVFLRHGYFRVTNHNPKMLEAWENELIKNCLAYPNKFTTSELCQYCELYLNCPARKALSSSIIDSLMGTSGDANYLNTAKSVLNVIDADNKDQRIVAEVIDDLMFRSRLANQMALEADAYLKTLLQRVGPIKLSEDYTLALKDCTRTSVSGVPAFKVLRSFLSDEQMAKCANFSLGRIKQTAKKQRYLDQDLHEVIEKELEAAGAIEKTPYKIMSVINTGKVKEQNHESRTES